MTWFPDQQLGVTVLSNAGNIDPGGIASKVAAVLVGDRMEPEKEKPAGEETKRAKTGAVNAADLPQYAGAYWSDELETRYTMIVRDGKLTANHIRHGEIALTPLAKDQFDGGQWFMQQINFTRDSSGQITGVTMGGGRVKGIRFVKMP